MRNAEPFVAKHSLFWGFLAGLLTGVLWVLSIPPFNFAEAAYVAFIPMLLWFSTGPDRRWALVISLVMGWAVWSVMLIWLRHVTLGGTVFLAAILSAIHLPWFLLAAWLQPRLRGGGFVLRAVGCIALAAGWVVLE